MTDEQKPENVTSDMQEAWKEAMSEQDKAIETNAESKEIAPKVERAELEELNPNAIAAPNKEQNLEVILDIPVVLSMEVGKAEVSIRNLLKLTQGSVVELDRYAGDPLDIYVNGTIIAKGEVVVVNEKFAIRITDVISTAERMKKLGDD